ncbi:MAG: twitching motility protein PilT [Verrucomicrobiota bacterium]|jgi:twitching motility protein PilT
MNKETVDTLLGGMLESGEGVSDLLFIRGKPPLVEVHGQLHEFPWNETGPVLTSNFIEELAKYILDGNERWSIELEANGACDCSYSVRDLARFRVNIYKQNGRHAIVMRRFPAEIPTLDKLALPPIFREIIKERNGIILITGAAGSGKTTTLAAMVNELNLSEKIHILTLEDPIEFLHPHRCAAISQRELGRDFPSFADGLRTALRQAPKVILVGEIRDRQSMEIALTASETGHVVFSTLHTVNAGQTIQRILGFFGRDEEEQVRQRLADTLRYIVSQRLVGKVDGGRLLVTEVVGNSLRTRETIRYGESEGKTFLEIIEAASPLGWHTFDQGLLKAREAELISEETALIYCTNKTKMRRDLDMLQRRQGVTDTHVPSGLKLDIVPPLKSAAASGVAPGQGRSGASSAA